MFWFEISFGVGRFYGYFQFPFLQCIISLKFVFGLNAFTLKWKFAYLSETNVFHLQLRLTWKKKKLHQVQQHLQFWISARGMIFYLFYLYPLKFILDGFFYYLILLLQSTGIQRESCIMPGICQILMSLIQWFMSFYVQIILGDIIYFEDFI